MIYDVNELNQLYEPVRERSSYVRGPGVKGLKAMGKKTEEHLSGWYVSIDACFQYIYTVIACAYQTYLMHTKAAMEH